MKNLDVGKTLDVDGVPYLILETEYDEKGVKRLTIVRIDRWNDPEEIVMKDG